MAQCLLVKGHHSRIKAIRALVPDMPQKVVPAKADPFTFGSVSVVVS